VAVQGALLAAALLVSLSLGAEFAHGQEVPTTNRGVAVGTSDVVKGEITDNDEDCFVVDLSAGGSLSLSLKADKGTDLLPAAFLKRPDGSVVSVTDRLKGLGKSKVSLRKFPIDETGLWAVCVTGAGTEGTYSLALKFKAGKKVLDPALVVPAGGFADCEFPAKSGDRLSVKIKELDGPETTSVAVLDPDGNPVAGADLTRKGAKISGKKIPLTSGFGTYSVRFEGSETGATTVLCKVVLKVAKVGKNTLELGPEPFPEDSTPFSGPAGQEVTLTGTGFVDGARVLFGAVESPSVSVVSDTTIVAEAPDGEDADGGIRVDLTVINPDGQESVLIDGFAFFGPPSGSNVTPAFSPLAGGVELTITGEHFHPGSTVTIGGLPAEDTVVVGFNTIICTTPASETAGAAPVIVTDQFGRSTDPIGGHSWVAGPTVTGASPGGVPSHGGTTVTLTGTNFRFGATRVFLNEEEVEDPEVTSPTTLTFPMLAGEQGEVTIQVQDEFGQGETKAGLLEWTRSMVEITGSSLPSAPSGTDFFGSTLSAGDLDDDDDVDLAITSADNTSVTGTWLLVNDGTGSFSDGTSTYLGAFSYNGDVAQGDTAALGDLDGDGADELLVSQLSPDTSTGTFYKGGYYYYVYYYTTYNGYYYYDSNTYLALRLATNDGSGNLAESTYSNLPFVASGPYLGYGERWQAEDMVLGDLDDDGDLDVLVTTSLPVVYAENYLAYYYNYPGYYYIYLYYVQTGYYSPATRVLLNDGSSGLSWKDDAFPDVYAYGDTTVSGAGLIEDWGGRAVAMGDLDGDEDGTLDVVIVSPYLSYNYYGYIFDGYYLPATGVFLNDGNAYFSASYYAIPDAYGLDYPGSYDYWQGDAVAVGDLDDDGDLDIVVGRRSVQYWYDTVDGEYRLLPAVRIFENGGSGNFTEATTSFLSDDLVLGGGDGDPAFMGVHAIAVGDLDSDGNDDLVLTGIVYDADDIHGGDSYADLLPSRRTSATRVLLSDGYGGFEDATATWLPSPSGGDWFQSHDLVLTDIDGDGDLDLVLVFDGVPDDSGGDSGNRPVRIFENR
jgi:hypothetical protein